MGLPGWYLSDPGTVLAFPVAERYGSDPLSVEETDLVIETERLRRYVYKQGTRKIRRVFVRLTAEEVLFFLDLHTNVQGQATPFYYTPDVDGLPDNAIFVRKEKDFRPRELDTPGVVDGVETALYDYVLELSEEPDFAEVQP